MGDNKQNTTVGANGNWDPAHPELMGHTAPTFRDVNIGGFDWANPGQIDLKQTNPALAAQLAIMQQYQTGIGGREAEAQNRAYTQSLNQASAMGLGNTAAGLGGANEASRQTGLGWDDRSIQLAQMIAQQTMAGQNQYSNYQTELGGAFGQNLGLIQQQNQRPWQQAQQLFQDAGKIGGMIAGVPAMPGMGGGGDGSSPGSSISGYGPNSSYSPGQYGGAPITAQGGYNPYSAFGGGY